MEGDTLHGPEEVQTSGIRRAEPSGPQTHRETDWDRSGAPVSAQDSRGTDFALMTHARRRVVALPGTAVVG
mgnify:CR=1